jgi:hypothetical protein
MNFHQGASLIDDRDGALYADVDARIISFAIRGGPGEGSKNLARRPQGRRTAQPPSELIDMAARSKG